MLLEAMTMRRHLILGLAAVLLTAAPGWAQSKAKAQNVPEIPYDTVPNFLKLPPDLYMGEGIGVAVNSKGHILVYTRSQRTRLFEFDQIGTYLKEIGEGLYGFAFAHSVRVDKDDNIWAVDEGSNMVIKFSPQGKVLMLLGRRPESVEGIEETPGFGAPPPPAQPYVFNRQTDVAFDPAGNIFVPDGYGNSRVVKYDKNGRFVKAIGQRGSGPGDFNTPHTIAADAKGNIYVGDRGNARIQVFDNDLNLRAIYDNVGNPWAICISPGPHQYLFSSNSNPDNNNAASWAVTGEVYKMELDGKIIGKFGKAGKGPGEFSTIHQMDCRNENEIVTAEITAWRVQKIKLRPTPASTATSAAAR
jgi:sugar lactone lactonase YvrE